MHVISIPYALMKANPLSWIQKVCSYKGEDASFVEDVSLNECTVTRGKQSRVQSCGWGRRPASGACAVALTRRAQQPAAETVQGQLFPQAPRAPDFMLSKVPAQSRQNSHF